MSDYASENYFSYPLIGEDFEGVLWCPDCDEETKVTVKIDINLSLRSKQVD